MLTESEAAFFHRRETHGWVRDLAVPGDWTIYAGLGVTIDRTGLSWGGLVDGLLRRFLTDVRELDAVRAHYDPVQRATILASYYDEVSRRTGRESAVAELRDDLRRLLYGPHLAMRGKLGQSIIEFAIRTVLSGHSVILVTLNYDEYLFSDLIEAIDVLKGSVVTAATGIDGGSLVVREPGDDEVAVDLDEASVIKCVYVHGFVGREPTLDGGVPIIDERDYATFGSSSQRVLEQLFRDRNVLVVGSSLSDTPLVGALLATAPVATAMRARRDGVRRVALLPRSARIGTASGTETWTDRRLEQMGVDPIYTDHHLQTAQFLHEVQKCIERGDGDAMVRPYSPRRYGTRLVNWWNEWFGMHCADRSSQRRHHELLARELELIRRDAGVPLGENLKLEAWVRWAPSSERTLALWASSVGTWSDLYTMRRDEITAGSQYKSVQIFCTGAPTFLAEPSSSSSRWKTYFGTPVWYDAVDGRLPVGVISLASMEAGATSTLREENLERLDAAVVRMQALGGQLFS